MKNKLYQAFLLLTLLGCRNVKNVFTINSQGHIQVTNATPGLNNNWFITNIGVS